MFTRILVPLDGTPFAESMLTPATLLAERCGAELLLVYATGLVRPFSAGSSPKQEAAAYLQRVADRLQHEGVSVQITVSPEMPADGILDQAEQQHADLIAMRTHGRMALESLLHPSVTWRVFRQSQAPIFTWRLEHELGTSEAIHALPHFMLDRTAPIMVPLDGSSLAERALPIACAFAQFFGNPLLLVRAAAEPLLPGVGADYPQELTRAEAQVLAAAEEYLQARQRALQEHGLTVEVEAALAMPVPYIEEVVKQRQAGLIVMAAHGRSGPGRLLLGGTARSLLGQAMAPVVLVRTELAVADWRSEEALVGQETLSGQRS